jgi:hypothetical protein
MTTAGRNDNFARAMGFLVFLLGVGIIMAVLWLAVRMWQSPTLGLAAARVPGASAADIGVGFGVLLVRIALLFLGSISGSLIANKGIRLYFTGTGAAPVVPVTVRRELREFGDEAEDLHGIDHPPAKSVD